MYIYNMNTYLSILPDEINLLIYKFIYPLHEIKNICLIYNNILDIGDSILLPLQFKLINELLNIYNININTMTTKQMDFMQNLINNFNYNKNNNFYLPITNINTINTIKNIKGEFNTHKFYTPEENFMLYDMAINEYNIY
jgi:hypothetical protein